MAPETRASLTEPPDNSEVPAPANPPATPMDRPTPAGPRTVANATVPKMRPTGLLSRSLATLTTPLIAPPIASKIPPRAPSLNSGRPVFGLIVPEPPRLLSIAASLGVMWARMLSPPRPLEARYCPISARPPLAMAIGWRP